MPVLRAEGLDLHRPPLCGRVPLAYPIQDSVLRGHFGAVSTDTQGLIPTIRRLLLSDLSKLTKVLFQLLFAFS